MSELLMRHNGKLWRLPCVDGKDHDFAMLTVVTPKDVLHVERCRVCRLSIEHPIRFQDPSGNGAPR